VQLIIEEKKHGRDFERKEGEILRL